MEKPNQKVEPETSIISTSECFSNRGILFFPILTLFIFRFLFYASACTEYFI
jgi:hypothetical protein